MDQQHEGRGGGFGRYSGMTIAEIEARFAQCASDPSMRSISAVLRLTREQLDARGQLGHYPTYAILAGGVGVACLVAVPFAPTSVRQFLIEGAVGGCALGAILFAGVWRVRHARQSNLEQEKRIRAYATVSLEKILAQDPKLKPLTREQVDTVKELIKRTGNANLGRLLDQAES